ncbi:Cof-type HAD-IIB family hydrolase [Paenibacillus hamazuiensis]|uniref:Cof-type HAD-IIB family hydrolase n=1 Tax=Paenibacillus hamazuiensis TaxID=2936508 RepID=UPI00200C951C|nr:Cof-type HAD-IIB family hydrolase [Paenibacillus hamazuiensis]
MDTLKGCLLVTDLDGTLLNKEKRISEENKAAIRRFVDQGGLFTLATGRIASSALVFAGQLPVCAPAILYNGAMIYDFAANRVVWERTLPDRAAVVVERIAAAFPGIGIEIYSGGKPHFVKENEVTDKHRMLEGFAGGSAGDCRQVPKPWHKVLLAWNPESLDAVEKEVAGWEMEDITFVRSDAKYFEILPKDATKGHALERLVEMLGINPSASVAVGDHMNDMEMIRRAGTGIAVLNAEPALHEVAKRSCKHHDEHALADVIEWIERSWPDLG